MKLTYQSLASVFGINGNGEFSCRGKYGPATHALLSNAANFKVFFGFDNVRNGATGTTVVDFVPMARMWTDAATVNASGGGGPVIIGSEQAGPWDNVVSVFVCITVVTNQTGLTTTAATTRARCPETPAEVATGLDGGGQPLTVTDNDGFIRRTFSQVLTVRANAGAFAAFN